MRASFTPKFPAAILPWIGLGCLALALAAGAALLFFFDPAQHGFYPRCEFHRLTGLNCPGCGGLRALHQLSHGQIAAALRLNALVVLGLPVTAMLGARGLLLRASGRSPRALPVRPLWLWLMLAVMVAFGILRNLPNPLLAHLSP